MMNKKNLNITAYHRSVIIKWKEIKLLTDSLQALPVMFQSLTTIHQGCKCKHLSSLVNSRSAEVASGSGLKLVLSV